MNGSPRLWSKFNPVAVPMLHPKRDEACPGESPGAVTEAFLKQLADLWQ
jgi:hypothetical protein